MWPSIRREIATNISKILAGEEVNVDIEEWNIQNEGPNLRITWQEEDKRQSYLFGKTTAPPRSNMRSRIYLLLLEREFEGDQGDFFDRLEEACHELATQRQMDVNLSFYLNDDPCLDGERKWIEGRGYSTSQGRKGLQGEDLPPTGVYTKRILGVEDIVRPGS